MTKNATLWTWVVIIVVIIIIALIWWYYAQNPVGLVPQLSGNA